MMPDARQQQWTVGRSRDNDVVVDAAGVRDSHCVIHCLRGAWSVTPQQGKIGIATDHDANVHWFDQRRTVSSDDSLWLLPDVRLPWPSESGAAVRLTIGRANDCDIVLEHSVISGRHATLIVGPQQTVVIRDQNSRNGLFVDAELDRRVAAAMLFPQDQVFLGSLAVEASNLIRQAQRAFDSQAAVPNIRPAPPTLSDPAASPPQLASPPPVETPPVNTPPPISVAASPNSRRRRGWSPVAKTVLPSVVSGLLLLACWWVFIRPAAAPDSLPLPPVVSQPTAAAPTARAQVAAALVPAPAAPAAAPPAAVASPLPGVPAPRQSLYWILIRHSESGDYFRLGSGVAVASDTVLTTASIVTSIDEMRQVGYADAAVVQVATGRRWKTEAHHIPDVFKKRTQAAARLVEDYEALVQQLGNKPANAPELRETIDKQAELVNVAMAATAAVDVGWLQVEQIPDFLSADTSHVFRPSQQVSSLTAGFDIHDPFFDAQAAASIQEYRYRVQAVGTRIDGIPDALKLHASRPSEVHEHVIGSPLIHNGQLVGLIVFQNGDTGQFEAISGPIIGLTRASAAAPPFALQ